MIPVAEAVSQVQKEDEPSKPKDPNEEEVDEEMKMDSDAAGVIMQDFGLSLVENIKRKKSKPAVADKEAPVSQAAADQGQEPQKGKPDDGKPSMWDTPLPFKILTVVVFSMTIFITVFIRMSLAMSMVCILKPPADKPKIHWPYWASGLILSAISWGKLLTPLTGLLADHCSPKINWPVGIAIEGILAALIPTVAPVSWVGVLVIRILTGICEGIVQTSLVKMVIMTFKPPERIAALFMLLTGGQLASLISHPLTAAFCVVCGLFTNTCGWPLTFYFIAALMVLWLTLNLIWQCSAPTKERHEASRGIIKANRKRREELYGKDTPWKKLLTCPALWANCFALFCQQCVVVTVNTFLPLFIKTQSNIPMVKNGLISALPVLLYLLSGLISAKASQVIRKKLKIKDRTFSVKVADAIASIGAGLFLMLMTFVGPTFKYGPLVFVCFAMTFAGIHYAGVRSCMTSVAPQFAGTVAGFSFTSLELAVLTTPLVVHGIVKTDSVAQWHTVWCTTGIISILPILFFCFWGAATTQIKPEAPSRSQKQELEEQNKAKKS